MNQVLKAVLILAGIFVAFAGVVGVVAVSNTPPVESGSKAGKAPAAAAASQKQTGVAASPGQQDIKAEDVAIAALSKSIVSVDHQDFSTPPALVLTLHAQGWDESHTFFSFADDALGILAGMKKADLLTRGRDVAFIVRADMIDGHGDSDGQNIARVNVPYSEIEKINFDSGQFTAWDLLNLSSVEFNSAHGRGLVESFCSSDKNSDFAPRFCTNASRI